MGGGGVAMLLPSVTTWHQLPNLNGLAPLSGASGGRDESGEGAAGAHGRDIYYDDIIVKRERGAGLREASGRDGRGSSSECARSSMRHEAKNELKVMSCPE